MKILHVDDIWDLLDTHIIGIPTNIGWNKAGHNIMGAGLAKEAAERFPNLPNLYGKLCKDKKSQVGIQYINTIDISSNVKTLCLIPTKAIREQTPWLSWKNESTYEFVEQSIKLLVESVSNYTMPIAIPPLGCGRGGLCVDLLLPILEKHIQNSTPVHLILKK